MRHFNISVESVPVKDIFPKTLNDVGFDLRKKGNTISVFASLLLSIIYILNGRKVIAWIL